MGSPGISAADGTAASTAADQHLISAKHIIRGHITVFEYSPDAFCNLTYHENRCLCNANTLQVGMHHCYWKKKYA